MKRAALCAWNTSVAVALFGAFLFALPAAPAVAQAADPVIAKVDGVEVRESDLTLAEEDLGSNIPQQLTGDARRDFILSYLTDIILVAKAAEGKKVADTADFKTKLNFIRNKLLMETILQSEGKTAVTEQAMKKVYEDAVKQMGGDEEVRARHILVPTEAEAKAIIAQIMKGDKLRKARQGEVEGPRRRGAGRRPRLFHQGPDGAGVRRDGVQAAQGHDLRPGEDAVRLAHHQASRTSAPRRRRRSSRSRTRSRPSCSARRRPTTSPSCARRRRWSDWTSRRTASLLRRSRLLVIPGRAERREPGIHRATYCD